jgi:NAD(P)-dependent dehydrogenase (short-subunit alcohol dehydrogenase family)
MLQRTLAINTVTPFILCRALMPQMADLGGGRVVNIASTAGLKGFRYTSAYCASKHALVGLTRALALEFAQKAVTINAVCPGWTDTDMLSQSVEAIVQTTGRSRDEARTALQQLNPMGRFTTPEEVAELVWFLATSPAAATMTGSTYVMDAGETA